MRPMRPNYLNEGRILANARPSDVEENMTLGTAYSVPILSNESGGGRAKAVSGVSQSGGGPLKEQ